MLSVVRSAEAIRQKPVAVNAPEARFVPLVKTAAAVSTAQKMAVLVGFVSKLTNN